MQLVEARGGGGSQVASAVYCCGVAGFCFLPPSSAPDALLSPDFFFGMGEDISECGGSGRESSQGYGYPRMCRTTIMTLWKLRPTEGLHVLLKVRSGSGDNDEGRPLPFTIHSATSTSTDLPESQCEYRRRRYGYFLRCESDSEWGVVSGGLDLAQRRPVTATGARWSAPLHMYRRSFRYDGGDARIRVVGLTTHWALAALQQLSCRAVVAVQCWPLAFGGVGRNRGRGKRRKTDLNVEVDATVRLMKCWGGDVWPWRPRRAGTTSSSRRG